MGSLTSEGAALATHQASNLLVQLSEELTALILDLRLLNSRTIAHQPHNREPEEVEQAISFIRTGMYLPPPEYSDASAEPELSERSSPTPDTGGLADTVDLTEAASLEESANQDTASETALRKKRRFRSNKSRVLEPALVRALVSVAENQDDAFQRVCLETLAELCKYPTKPSRSAKKLIQVSFFATQAFSTSMHCSTEMHLGCFCKPSSRGHMTCLAK